MNQHSILVLFKDNLTIGGKDEFPITIKSETIREHQEMSENTINEEQKNNEQSFLHFKEDSILRNVDVKEITPGNFVWGWWKKPGESHNNMFKIIYDICQEDGFVNTLLYNRYMRRIYTAKITDIYYVPYASTVSIPEKWKWKCPGYYSNSPHFCGAYFSMKLETKPNVSQNRKSINDYEEYNDELIIPCEDPQFVLNNYFVDRNTFDDFFMDGISVIKQAEGVIDKSKEIIDKPISTLSLKLTDQTIFLLRKSTQKEKIRELFNNGQDNEISKEFKNLPISDAIEFVRVMTRDDWSKLFTFRNSIIAINELFKITDMPITVTDIRLVCALIREKVLSNDMDKLSDREKRIIEWLLSKDVKTQRENASLFFSSAWELSIKEIKMAGMEEYFGILPQLEEISSSTKQIKKKLYRDHLNHNIRAGLMSSYLVSIFKNDNENMRLAFYSGLLHDIAHPLSSYEGTIISIQEGLAKLGITKSSVTDSIIDKDKLKNLVNIVAFLASIPNIKDKKEISESWTDLKKMVKIIKPELLYEEIMCSMSYEHSFLSAAIVFNTAVYGILQNKDDEFYGIVKQIFGNQEHYKDLFQIIQCIALHDRKAVSDYWGLNNFQDIEITEFFLPVITIIADEIQEWGRPISSNEKSIVTDCDIEYNDEETFIVKYTCNFKKEILKGIEYCFLEHFFSKDRIFSKLKNDKGNSLKLELQMDICGELKIYTSNSYTNELALGQDENDVLWPENVERRVKIREEDNKRLIAMISYPSDNKSLVSSFIVFESDHKDIINKLKRNLSMNFPEISNMVLSRDYCKLEISDNIVIEGKVNSYYFTPHLKDKSVVSFPNDHEINDYKIIDKIGILIIESITIKENQESKSHKIQVKNDDMHLFPQPHFLDLDWRFNYQSINSILNFISTNINKGKVCYLGCPSLALYHNRQISSMATDFTLFDKGHFALNKWLDDGYIDRNHFVKYDVQGRIPNEYLNQYDIVIMDPPWYKEFYELFLKRAIALVKNKGIIGIAEYPGYPRHKEKVDGFKKIREEVFKHSVNFSPYCSIEVAYAEPAFEKLWQGNKEFVHSAIGAYRPAYMDFYLINNPDYGKNKDETLSIYSGADDKNIEYSNGYIRLKKDYEKYFNNNYYWKFSIRTSLTRISKKEPSWVGWSTNNTVIYVDEKQNGCVIKNKDELISHLEEYENSYLSQSV